MHIRPVWLWWGGREAALWLLACTAGASRLKDLKPRCNSVQGLCLETVLTEGNKKRRGTYFFLIIKSPTIIFFFFLSQSLMLCCLSSSSVFRSFLFISEINYVVQHISLCILIQN